MVAAGIMQLAIAYFCGKLHGFLPPLLGIIFKRRSLCITCF